MVQHKIKHHSDFAKHGGISTRTLNFVAILAACVRLLDSGRWKEKGRKKKQHVMSMVEPGTTLSLDYAVTHFWAYSVVALDIDAY